jgi:hypothetical protein
MNAKYILFISIITLLPVQTMLANKIESAKVDSDLSAPILEGNIWKDVKVIDIDLMGQPMTIPKPSGTHTSKIHVQSVNDGTWIQFRVIWKDTEKSDGKKVGKFSDALAVQFAVDGDAKTTPVFMGGIGKAVHIIQWKARYDFDREHKRTPNMDEIYPNIGMDMYPMEFKDSGTLTHITQQDQIQYSAARAAGNPHSFAKIEGVNELLAEGYGSSAPLEASFAKAISKWENGEWTVVITRPIQPKQGSIIKIDGVTPIAFAVWQGGKDEVGSRKSVTMIWINLLLNK